MNTETIPSDELYDHSISLVDSFNKQIKEAYENQNESYENQIISYRMEMV